jgi:hypothetical protein
MLLIVESGRSRLQSRLFPELVVQGIGVDANAIPDKSAQKILRAADQILRAGRSVDRNEEREQ